ncbi:MAG: NUDIX domain-containing protein [bacterium]
MKPIFTEIVDWNGLNIHREFYPTDNFDQIPKNKAFQSQAVCFVNSEEIAIFEDTDGHRGMPGGHIETGENYEETLEREIFEESACVLIDCGPTCYIKEWDEKTPNIVSYGLRYWATVRALDQDVKDPCCPGRERRIVKLNKADSYLGWGRSGEILLNLAKSKVKFK